VREHFNGVTEYVRSLNGFSDDLGHTIISQ
jgi:hypothetical protein